MKTVIAAKADAELKKAYSEMLEGCLQHPDQWQWYAMWMIELLDGTHIGSLCFKGLDAGGIAEIGYGILEKCGFLPSGTVGEESPRFFKVSDVLSNKR